MSAVSVGVWIRLTKGYATIVDREDAGLAEKNWAACYRRSAAGTVKVYAVRAWRESGVQHREFLHHAVAGRSSRDTDHQDGDSLNNRRGNLRDASRSQNNANAAKRPRVSSRFKGVFFHRTTGKWCAQICCNAKKKHLGLFREEVDAAQAYNFSAEELFGEFSRMNLPL